MLIGIISDTHDNISRTKVAIERLNREHVDLVLHAGDFIAPFMIEILKDLKSPMIGVFGNNDGDRNALIRKCSTYSHLSLPGYFARLEKEGFTIALFHGHNRDLLQSLIDGNNFDLIVTGHTHKADISKAGKTLVVNPGEVCGYLTGKSTFALVDTKKIQGSIIQI